jgi:hypothetical protein
MISESSTLQARALGEPSQNAFAAERYVCTNILPHGARLGSCSSSLLQRRQQVTSLEVVTISF